MARKLSYEDSAVIHDLKFWGFHHGKCLAWEGYTVENTVSRLLEGWGGTWEHRILMKDLSEKVARRWWPIHTRIVRFPTELQSVLIARYCVPPKTLPDGKIKYHERRELAEACGVSERKYRERLGKAKSLYKKLIFPDVPFYSKNTCISR